jgi:hypothetical protein
MREAAEFADMTHISEPLAEELGRLAKLTEENEAGSD